MSGSSVFKKLPPEVVRELKRHVSPKPLPKPGQKATEPDRKGMGKVLAGCVALTATAASFPLLATWWIGNLNERDDPLTAPQVRRGAFQNSGTRDIGKDPNWDFRTGQYKHPSGYQAMLEEEKNQRLSAEFHAMPSDTYKRHEKEIEDFAKRGINRKRAQRMEE